MIYHLVAMFGRLPPAHREVCEWEAAAPAPPPGVAEGTLFPHVFGPLDRAAVRRVLEVRWDAGGRATGLC
ncbi:hypothetical protein GCM10023257_26770 [Streptomyces hyderabadensis]|uniref:Transposase n=1 Tax=Streptomyces hyderabadensis TaxID=598549 RepID=A0ABP9I3I4_9ACTN